MLITGLASFVSGAIGRDYYAPRKRSYFLLKGEIFSPRSLAEQAKRTLICGGKSERQVVENVVP